MRRAAARRQGRRRNLTAPGAVRAPYPGFVEPCLASQRNAVPKHGLWLHEIKHDGYRAQAHVIDGKASIYTRRGYDWTDRFASIAQALGDRELILDGEVVVLDARGVSDFHSLQDDLARGRKDRLVYFAFDVLYLDGFDLRQVQLMHRKQLLAELLASVSEGGRIRVSGYIEADPTAVFEQACAMHVEGIVSKERHSTYKSGRQESWIKVKCIKTDTFPIVAFVEKLGASPRRIASLYLGRWDGDRLLYAGKAQTGFQQSMLYELRERLDPFIRKSSPLTVPVKKPKATWVEPVLQAEIAYSSLTADKLLRAPVYKGIRDDLLDAPAYVKRKPPMKAQPRVPGENILQLLPDAVVPAKEELSRYWERVSTQALEYIAHRPLKLVRHTRGTTFYHKGRLPPVPASVHELRIEKREGGQGIRLWIEDLQGLLGLLEIGAVELHTWNCTVDDIEHPDVMVFDLDPGPGIAWEFVRDTALALRQLLRGEGLDAWPKLTGGKGVHLMVPLPHARMSHNEVHRYSRALAEKLAAGQADRYTTSAGTADREGRLFIDYLRNGRGTTAVATYSPRARPGFPIAAPTTWDALKRGIRPDAFSIYHPFRQQAPRKPQQQRVSL